MPSVISFSDTIIYCTKSQREKLELLAKEKWKMYPYRELCKLAGVGEIGRISKSKANRLIREMR